MSRSSTLLAAAVAVGGLFAAGTAVANPGEVDPGFKLSVFGDAYGAYQTAEVGSPQPGHRAYAANSPAYTAENGFSLSFIGLDASWMSKGDAFGVVTSLRFGPSVPLFHGNNPALGIDNLVQGYVTWQPVKGLTLDLGQFGTIFGAEVAESWNNLNYTRGGLYYLMQPFWHTGLRASYAFSDTVTGVLMVVNGVNNISDDDEKPSIGAQVQFAPNDDFSMAIGGLFAGDAETDPSGFDTFLDLVVNASFGSTSLVFNADYNINADTTLADGTAGDASFFGVSLAVGQAFSETFGAALRFEFLSDTDNTLYSVAGVEDAVTVQTITLTLDFKPFKGYDNFVLRWDNRYETASEDIFLDGDSKASASWITSVVGIAVHSDVLGGN